MNDLEKKGFKSECTINREGNQILAALTVEGISEKFSAYSDTIQAAKNAAANLALTYIAKNNVNGSNDVYESGQGEEGPIQMLKKLYPECELNFESVCIVDVGGTKFESRGENRGIARVTASAAALEALNGIHFENLDSYLEEKKKETKERKDVLKHPASALHEVVGQRAIFNFDEEILADGMRRRFTCKVNIDEKLFTAIASNKRLAKYNAALTALNGLGLSKQFKLMAPPVDNLVGFNTGDKRNFNTGYRGRGTPSKRRRWIPNIHQSFTPSNLWDSSNPFTGKFEPTPPRGGGRGRGSYRARGSPVFRGRGGGQVVGDFSSTYPPEESYGIQDPGYGPPREPYPEFPPQEMGGYNQGFNPDYNSDFQYPGPSPQPARGHAYSQQRGSSGFGAFQQNDLGYQYSY